MKEILFSILGFLVGSNIALWTNLLILRKCVFDLHRDSIRNIQEIQASKILNIVLEELTEQPAGNNSGDCLDEASNKV